MITQNDGGSRNAKHVARYLESSFVSCDVQKLSSQMLFMNTVMTAVMYSWRQSSEGKSDRESVFTWPYFTSVQFSFCTGVLTLVPVVSFIANLILSFQLAQGHVFWIRSKPLCHNMASKGAWVVIFVWKSFRGG